ncbi:hypothetical protein PENNAL_c0229G06360, partial [Penicillium nalgiovense]
SDIDIYISAPALIHAGCETFASNLTISTFIIPRRLSHRSGLAEPDNPSPPRLLSAFDGPTTYVEDTGDVPQPSDESSICIVDFVWTHGATRRPSLWFNFTCSVCSSCRGQGCGHRVHCWLQGIPESPALGYTQIYHIHADNRDADTGSIAGSKASQKAQPSAIRRSTIFMLLSVCKWLSPYMSAWKL